MKCSASLLAVFATMVLAAILSCTDRGRDKTINVADNDAAMARARAALPQFWQAFEQGTNGTKDFALKVRIVDEHGTEHFWATDIERQGARFFGTINNDPNIVTKVKLGDRLPILETDISDWMYMRNGKMVGNYTLRVLFKQMPAKEVAAYQEIMAEP